MNVPKRIKYKGQIYEKVELKENFSLMYETGPKENTIIKNGVLLGAYGVPKLDAHQGEYINGVYVPYLDPDTMTPIVSKKIWDEWE